MSHTRFTVLMLFAIIAALSVNPASAMVASNMVNLQNHNNAISDQGYLYGGGLDSNQAYYTGVYSWTNAGYTPGLGSQVPNWGFCIELTEGAVDGWATVIPLETSPLPPSYGTPMGMAKANYIRELWGRDFDPAWATGANTQMAEAFNVAIWEIIYETDPTWDVTSGAGFHVAGGVEQAATANLWLSQLNGDTAYFANNLYAVSVNGGQDYMVQIPEPATLSLLAVGAAALLRKRKS